MADVDVDDDANEAVADQDEEQEQNEAAFEAEAEVEAKQEAAAVEATPSMDGNDEPSSSSSSDSEYDSDSDSDSSSFDGYDAGGYQEGEEPRQVDDSPEANFRDFSEVLDGRSNRRREEEEEQDYVFYEDLFDFPRDREKWREEDLRELWADAPVGMTKPGWDPVLADEDDWEAVINEAKSGRPPPIAPFYLPYRKPYPAIPDNHYDISNPKSVVEELDRIEEFLKWVSYVFEDGSTYEGTVWDDLANGKGVYVAEDGLVRYEGEWLQNEMEGHGVVEVDIPDVEPVPGSKLEAKMRAEGKIISRDFMSPKDKRWLEMDIEDSMLRAGNRREIPFYERDEWVKVFGKKPERGRYRYAGQWKHGRMHGCGVYEVNERMIHGRFYFGEYVEDPAGCDSDVSTLHAGIAEVAAAKARMFVNKPDGMVREERGPYSDPQHPYFYEEDDVWMAPGFINQFYEVPDYWKVYVQEVDQERDMWLNSFYKAPLRIPMPAELEHWWSKGDDDSEFVLINKDPEPDPEDPSKLIYTEDPLILHTSTGRLINYVDDEKHGVRLFWQPYLKEGEDVDPEKAEFLPLGYDEFFGRATPVEEEDGKLMGLVSALKKTLKPQFDRLQKWAEEQKKVREMNRNLIEQELEFIEAEISLDEAIEDMELELKEKQDEEEKRAVKSSDTGDFDASADQDVGPGDMVNEDEDEDGDEDDDEDGAPTSFGTVNSGKIDDGPKESKSGKVPFSSISLSFPVATPQVSVVPTRLSENFLSWKKGKQLNCANEESSLKKDGEVAEFQGRPSSVHFPAIVNLRKDIRATQKRPSNQRRKFGESQLYALARILSSRSAFRDTIWNPADTYNFNILSLHVPVPEASISS